MKSNRTASKRVGRRRKSFLACMMMLSLALVIFLPAPSLTSMAPTASIRAVLSQESYPAGGRYPILFAVKVTEPWFLHGPHESEGMLATRLTFSGSGIIEITDVQFPPPKKVQFPFAEEPLEVYHGDFTVSATFHVSESATVGVERIEAKLSISSLYGDPVPASRNREASSLTRYCLTRG
jgi:hypothetical protein